MLPVRVGWCGFPSVHAPRPKAAAPHFQDSIPAEAQALYDDIESQKGILNIELTKSLWFSLSKVYSGAAVLSLSDSLRLITNEIEISLPVS